MTRSRTLAIVLTLVACFAAAFLAIGEGVLRYLGHTPKPRTTESHLEGSWAAMDTRLGWVNRPGAYPSFDPGQRIMHFETDHTRRVTGQAKTAAPGLLFVGCSFTQGYGVEDQQTFASILDDELPSMKVINFGTGGYGTYQSLLRLRDELRTRNDVGYIVYPFIDDHPARNVAAASWIQSLELMDGSNFVPPHVRLRDKELKEFAGGIEKVWTLEMHSALIHLLHKSMLAFSHTVPREEQVKVARALISEMAGLARSRGIPFLVVGLMVQDPGLIAQTIDKDVRFVDCRLPSGLSPEMRLGGTGHPDEKAHKIWAQCIKNAILR
jgi:hypothetical protein